MKKRGHKHRPTRLLIERRLAEAKVRDDALMAANAEKFRLRELVAALKMRKFDRLSPHAQQHAREYG